MSDSEVILIPIAIPQKWFTILNHISIQRGESVGSLVNNGFKEFLEKLLEEEKKRNK